MECTRQEVRDFRQYLQGLSLPEDMKRIANRHVSTPKESPFPTVKVLRGTLDTIAAAKAPEKDCFSYFGLAAELVGFIYQDLHGEPSEWERGQGEHLTAEYVYFGTIRTLARNGKFFRPNPHTNIYPCRSLPEGIYSLFRNKLLYMETLSQLCEVTRPQVAYMVVEYLHRSRQYHIAEGTFASSAYGLIRSVRIMTDLKAVTNIIDGHLTEVRRIFGIYDISRRDIDFFAETYSRLEEESGFITARIQEFQAHLRESHQQIAALDATLHAAAEEAKEQAIAGLAAQAERIQSTLNDALDVFKGQVIAAVGEGGEGQAGGIPAAAVISRIENAFHQEHPPVPILDSLEPLQSRCQQLLSLKRPGEIYHHQFDAMAKLVLMGNPVLVVGPSGAGKTHAIRQLSEIMGLNYYNLSYINEEYKLTGFRDASSNYDTTSFYLAYKYGGLCFFDELDNSHPGAVLLLNEFLGTKKGASFIFPNKEVVQQHKYFRLVAASNTWGNGADRIHNVRAKLDGATVNRFTALAYGYDARVEDRLAPDTDLLAFLRAYRNTLAAMDIPQPVTYRDFEDLYTFTHQNVFTKEEALRLKLVRNARVELQQKIIGAMSDGRFGPYLKTNPYFAALMAIAEEDAAKGGR